MMAYPGTKDPFRSDGCLLALLLVVLLVGFVKKAHYCSSHQERSTLPEKEVL